MKLIKGNILVLLVLLAIPTYAIFEVFTKFAAEGVHRGRADENAAMFPLLISAFMIALILVQLIRERSTVPRDDQSEPDQGSPVSLGSTIADMLKTYRTSLIIFALFILYIILFDLLGYVISTVVFLVAAQWVLGVRSIARMAVYTTVVSTAVWVVFAKVLNLVLPYGVLLEGL